MRARSIAVWLTLCAVLVSSPAFAQQHVADSGANAAGGFRQGQRRRSQSAGCANALERSDVKALASQMGLDLRQANTAVAQLTGDELASVAQSAGAVQADLAGGNNTVTISVTTLLLILIIIILVAN